MKRKKRNNRDDWDDDDDDDDEDDENDDALGWLKKKWVSNLGFDNGCYHWTIVC